MFQSAPGSGPQRIGFLLVPNFSMMAFTAAVEPLRAANRLSGKELYEWRIFTVDGEPAQASNGIEVVADAQIDAVDRFPAIIVCAGLDVQDVHNSRLFAWIRRMERAGSAVGALCTGSQILARAGLLDGYRCTIHWENLGSFTEEFPDIEVTTDLFEIDRKRFTCSGGTAALDMMLHMIALQHGHDLATAVSEQFIHDRIREPHDHQRMGLRARLGISHSKLIGAISEMEANPEYPLRPSELAQKVGLSTRQLERLFRSYLQCTPTRYYLKLRLERARHLLKQTSMSVFDVALACGFVSASHFSKCYREFYGHAPREERRLRSDAAAQQVERGAGKSLPAAAS
ncbi:MAG: GlxA family transcriptional regulator [Alphaproteobacteria bacterium]|nr:GlxA family transcriptional regulator [Alphaproteobacteria bacterium]